MTGDLVLWNWGMKVLILCKEYQQISLNMKCERLLVHFIEWSQLQQMIQPCAKSVFIHRQISRDDWGYFTNSVDFQAFDMLQLRPLF